MSLRLRIMLATLVVVVVGSLTMFVVADQGGRLSPPPTAPGSAQPSTSQPTPIPGPPDGDSFRDFVFDPATVSAPMSSKTQSKAWFAHGAWWAAMFAPPADQLRIYRLDPATQVWTDTATLIDERPTTDVDMLWTGDHLYAVAAGTRPTASHEIRIVRFTFDEGEDRFVRDADYPVTIAPSGAPATSIAIDSTGTLWVAYGLEGRIWLTHSLEDDAQWSVPRALTAPEARVDVPDVASIVAFGPGRIGVLWTNQLRASVYFSAREDGAPDDAWSEPKTVVDRLGTDDHLSVKPYPLADGQGTGILAAIKTALDEKQGVKSLDPLILLAVYDRGRRMGHAPRRPGPRPPGPARGPRRRGGTPCLRRRVHVGQRRGDSLQACLAR